MKRADLAHEHTKDGKDEQAHDVAEAVAVNAILANGDLGDGSTVTEDEDSHQHEHLKTLQNVDEMSRLGAEDAEEGLSEIAERVAIGIHVHEDTPDVPAGNGRHETENRVESDTRSEASVGESPASRKVSPARALRNGKKMASFVMGEFNTYAAPWGPRISVVIRKKTEPQLAVLRAREACLHSRSVTVVALLWVVVMTPPSMVALTSCTWPLENLFLMIPPRDQGSFRLIWLPSYTRSSARVMEA